jgi:hypothetical protein
MREPLSPVARSGDRDAFAERDSRNIATGAWHLLRAQPLLLPAIGNVVALDVALSDLNAPTACRNDSRRGPWVKLGGFSVPTQDVSGVSGPERNETTTAWAKTSAFVTTALASPST